MPKDRKYKIIATRDGPNDYEFRLRDIGGGEPNLVFNKDTDGMKKRDYYRLEFKLENQAGCDLKFVDDSSKVLSACHEDDSVNGCAPEGSNFLPVVFVDPSKRHSKDKLYVINTDAYVEKFCFGFSFVSPSTGETAYFDPGGENEDRGQAQFDWSYALVGGMSGALAGAGTASFAGNEFIPSVALLYGVGGGVVGLIVGVLLGRR